MRAPVTAAIIARDEPLLRDAVSSVREHVDEVVVVDTGSKPEILREYMRLLEEKLVDKVVPFAECNNADPGDKDFGLIEDFSMARARSFSLASHKWILWLDADDKFVAPEGALLKVVQRGENLSLQRGQPVGFIFPYEYAYDAKGTCICIHYRERLISDRKAFKWVNPVHEVLIPVGDTQVAFETNESVVWKHQRQYGTKVTESGRNLRIMRKHLAKEGDADARLLYYFGTECSNNGLHDEALAALTKYVGKSGWDDEKCMACLRIVATHLAFGRVDEALSWSYRAVHARETWAEGYFALARVYYHLGMGGGPATRRNWERCAHFAKIGLALPPTRTLLFVNPLERAHEIHTYLNIALNHLGDVAGAAESAKVGLAGNADDTNLQHNLRLYEGHLRRSAVVDACIKLRESGDLSAGAFDLIHAVLHKLPVPVPAAGQEPVRPAELPPASGVVEGARGGLDVVFACGDAWEQWNPETVKRTGIGGSETAVIEMSKRLAARGHRVRVYTSCGPEASYDGVDYLQSAKLGQLVAPPDILVAWRNAHLLELPAKAKLLWVHDIYAAGATQKRLLEADRVLGLSRWHCDFLRAHHKIGPAQVYQTRNGVDLARFDHLQNGGAVERNPRKAVCSSSLDRYLPSMLAIWPRVRARVPVAELHLFYGFELWKGMAAQQQDLGQLGLIASMEQQLEAMKSIGVTMHGRVDQATLAREYLSAGVWALPTWFSETSCIGCMEAHAAGCRMVTSPIAALNETGGDRAVLIPGDWMSESYQAQFAKAVVDAMLAPEGDDRAKLVAYARDHFSWDGVADDWENLFEVVLGEALSGAMLPYHGLLDSQANA